MSTLDRALQALFKRSAIDVLWKNASITSAFNPQTLQIPELQKYNFIMLLSQYSGGSYFNNSLIIPTEIGTNGAIAVGITMLVSRNFHIVDKAITFENGRLRSTYGSDGTTNNTVALPAYIFGIQLLGGVIQKIKLFLASLSRREVQICLE